MVGVLIFKNVNLNVFLGGPLLEARSLGKAAGEDKFKSDSVLQSG